VITFLVLAILSACSASSMFGQAVVGAIKGSGEDALYQSKVSFLNISIKY